jgi:6-phosphogluconolactonase
MPNKTILTWKDADELSQAAALFFVAECHRCIAQKGSFVVALSGGSTPKKLFQLLAASGISRNILWKQVFLFWSDERFVPLTDADSNYRMAKENLLDHISIPKKNVFATPVKGSPEDCARQYEDSLRRFFNGKKPVFDWLLLGAGPDGHTASLFPGTDILDEKKRLVKEVWVEAKSTWRISFTYPLINKAENVVFLVSGAEKAPVIKEVMKKTASKNPLPVQGVQPTAGQVWWMLDEAAAGNG